MLIVENNSTVEVVSTSTTENTTKKTSPTDNVNSAFGNLREDKDFSDATLACEDGQQVEDHKAVLAASSPFVKKLLRHNKHSHPLIYLRGMKSDDLFAIVDN